VVSCVSIVVVVNCYVASSDVASSVVASCVVANCIVASCYVANCMGIINGVKVSINDAHLCVLA
jgi:hypothetical protein